MHSFASIHIHCVWSTKNREPVLHSKYRERLWPYVGGIARENKMKSLAIGGASDHIHVLLSLPSTISVAKAIQLLKGNSSKWIHETFSEMRSFEWQEGYGAFSVGISTIEATRSYIRNQSEHHRNRTFGKNSKPCFGSMALVLTKHCSIEFFRPCRDLAIKRLDDPALKRWAIFSYTANAKGSFCALCVLCAESSESGLGD